MKTAYDIIKRPIITEKSMAETADKKYTFDVEKYLDHRLKLRANEEYDVVDADET